MKRIVQGGAAAAFFWGAGGAGAQNEPLFPDDIEVRIEAIGTDPTVNYDYDIVYVRAPRAGDKVHKRFYLDFSSPVTMEPGADLMLLHPDGSEELLVAGGAGSITDPFVSFNGEWIFFTHIYNLEKASQWNPPKQGADIFKIHLKSKRVVRLTNQQFTPNTGAADWSSDYRRNEQGKTHLDYGGCPIDLDYDPEKPDRRGYGWAADDNRPILTLPHPREDAREIAKIVIGLHDYLSGLEEGSLTVRASVEMEGVAAGENLAKQFVQTSQGVLQWVLEKPQRVPPDGVRMEISVRDRAGNEARVVRRLGGEQKRLAGQTEPVTKPLSAE